MGPGYEATSELLAASQRARAGKQIHVAVGRGRRSQPTGRACTVEPPAGGLSGCAARAVVRAPVVWAGGARRREWSSGSTYLRSSRAT